MTILVVEDDMLIRMILVEELLDAGYTVEEADTGDRAKDLLDSIEALRVLVTDIHMPGGCDGIALAAHVRTRQPEVPIIYTTGRPDALNRVNHLGDNQYLVRKPYVPSEIISRLRELVPG